MRVFALLCLAIRFTSPVNDHIRYAASSAAWSGNMNTPRMTRLLGVDIHSQVQGRGPLLVCAAWTGQQKIIAYLLNAGVDIETTDKFGGTALSRAAQEGHLDSVRMWIEAGANVNVQDLEGGNTPWDLCRMNSMTKGFDPTPILDLLATAGGDAVTTIKYRLHSHRSFRRGED
jgi:hypothetical protein